MTEKIPSNLDDLNPLTEDTQPSEPQRKPLYKEPAMIAAVVLVLLALTMLLIWLKGNQPTIPTAPVEEPTLPVMLNEPEVKLETPVVPTDTPEPTPTVFIPSPTATIAPRSEVITYTIQEGETISTIAAKFGLWPESILWANRWEIGDSINDFTPGKQIFILPVDGIYHVWTAGESLNAVAKYYGVEPDTIIDYPANNLNRDTLGSVFNPNIAAGTRLVVPGGTLPNYIANDRLLYYAAVEKLNSLTLGTSETHPEPRTEIIAYEVKQEDTIFTIAEDFNLDAETILWANRYLIGDTPDGIFPGQRLIILPEDGVYHAWSYGEGLNSVSRFYQVEIDEIISEPLNQINPAEIGDYSLPRIETGTFLYVPGGVGATPSWVVIVTDPGTGLGVHPNVSYLGAYACNSTAFMQGSGYWQYPTDNPSFISGYEYNPPVHNGLDYGGDTGDNLYAVDSGVIIYAGWSDRGYGNTIVIDHGNGYISLYGHLMDGGLAVSCGSVVYGGQVIGYMGSTGKSTGSHLHFEIRYNGSPVNPHGFGL